MRITLFRKFFIFALLSFTVLVNPSFAQKRLIAITIDDLPFVGESKNFHLNMIIDVIKANEVPATGFIIAGEVSPANWKMLHKFRDAGLGLGNHTFSHLNLNKVDTEAYIEEIDAADKMLMPVLTEPKFFRYPYLAMSGGSKKEKVLHYLSKKNYQVAPITIDSKDFIFNQLLLDVPQNQRRNFLGALKVAYVDFIWQQTLRAEEHNRYNRKPDQAQILLIHANLLNAYVLPDIINLYKQNGFSFVNLEDALKTFEPPKMLAKKEKSQSDVKIEEYMDWD